MSFVCATSEAGASESASAWSVRFEARDFSRPISPGACVLRVERLEWREEGGPFSGQVRVDGELPALNNLAQLLRCPVSVCDAGGSPAWWGFVNSLGLHLDGVVYRLSLDGLANRVAVRWSDEDPYLEEAQSSYQYQTAWEDDLPSQRQFGIKEMVFSIGEGRLAEALAARKTHLNARRLPHADSRPEGGEGRPPYGVLHLQGWYATLGWRMWNEPRGFVGNIARGGLDFAWGHSSSFQRVKQSFYSGAGGGWEASDVWLRTCRVGTPSDNLLVELCDDSGGAPGTLRASWSVAGASLSMESGSWLRLAFPTPFTLAGSTYYVLQLRRSGAASATDYFKTRVEEDALIDGAFASYNGSTWVARTPNADMVLAAFGQEESTRQVANICAPGAAGQFLSGVRVRDASGLKTRLFRPGKLDALEEVHGLLLNGSASGERLVARVTSERVLVVEKRPAPQNPQLRILPGGEVAQLNGRRLLPHENPVGKWALLAPLLMVGGHAGAPGRVYVTRAVWQAGRLRVEWA